MTARMALWAGGPVQKQDAPRIYFDGALDLSEMEARRARRYRERSEQTDRIAPEMEECLNKIHDLLLKNGPMKTVDVLKELSIPPRLYDRVRFIATHRLPFYEDFGEMGLL